MREEDTLDQSTSAAAAQTMRAREGLEREIHAPPQKSAILPIGILLLLAAAAGGGWYFWQQSKTPEAPAIVAAPTAPKAETQPEPAATHYPAPAVPEAEVATAKPLPALDESDPIAREALLALIGSETMQKLFSTQELVRHLVVTVDNLPRRTVAARLNPVKPAGGEFKVAGSDQQRTISAENAARYAPYVLLAAKVDAKQFVNAYGRMYPLFQKAYEDLGYPKSYFNDRLIAVIDHLIGAPEVNGPIAVVAPHVQYQYADAELEAQSAGRKFLMRVGPENAAVIKAKLREIRRELTKTGTGK